MTTLPLRASAALKFTLARATPDLHRLIAEGRYAGEFADELTETFMRVLAQVVCYSYALLFLASASVEVAGRIFRSESIQMQIREDVVRITRNVFEAA